jgi:hypothetical protein
MPPHRLATYSVGGNTRYGAATGTGVVDLSARFGNEYPTLREAIAAGALVKLAEDAARRSPDHALDAITWQPPIPSPEKIICIGVNYPDRNAEYKDGQDAPKYPSMFMRTPRSFVGHNAPLVRPRASAQLDYEGELVLVIGKAGRHIKESDALDHIAGEVPPIGRILAGRRDVGDHVWHPGFLGEAAAAPARHARCALIPRHENLAALVQTRGDDLDDIRRLRRFGSFARHGGGGLGRDRRFRVPRSDGSNEGRKRKEKDGSTTVQSHRSTP